MVFGGLFRTAWRLTRQKPPQEEKYPRPNPVLTVEEHLKNFVFIADHQIRTKSAIMNVMNAKRKSDDDAGGEKRKGRKKGFVWSHVLTDEEGKVTCMHCGDLIKVNFGEKVIIRPLVRSAFTFLMA
jgi:hypothetical protein